MGGLIWNLVAPFFATPRSYAEVLSKIAGFAFYETYAITFLLRDIPAVDKLFRSAESYGHLGAAIGSISSAATLNIAGLVIAVSCAVLSHAVHLHDRISDVLGIRRRFDRYKILFPLAQLVGSYLTGPQQDAVGQQRDRLMREVFYRYASSRADKPLVDKHDIEHALAAWAWFWVCVEAIFFLGLSAIIGFALSASKLGAWFLVAAAAAGVLGFLQHLRLGRYARVQIEAIASDPAASQAVRGQFNAL